MMRLGPWRIRCTLGRDLSGTYYAGSRDDGERATLYVLSGAAVPGEPLNRLIGLHRDVSHPGLIRFRGTDRDGSDLYLIADAVDDALASLRNGRRPDPGQVGAFGAALAAALAAAHDHDLVHGGLDLDNVLWAPDRTPQILGTGVSALADRVTLARDDVAALGRLLCTLIAGRHPLGAGEVERGGAGSGRLGQLVRQLAEPGAAISMREAHALLAEGEPTQAASGSGIVEALTVCDRPRRTGDREARAAASAEAPPILDHACNGPKAGASGGPTSPALDQLGGYVGRYRIVTRLGRGGMGEVFLAEDPALRRGVAIKRIRPGLEHDRTFRARLRREAQLAAHLSHRAIVQVFDLVTDDNADHVVMEYVAGSSLHTLVHGSPTHFSEVLRIAAELADGLAYAHQHGVIHRDLKLENVLIGTDHQPKIADFGLAHCVATARDGAAEESLTGDGLAIGTSRAMSPEQAQGHDLDARSDLFSFGVMLYELVTGTSPFASGNRVQTILRVVHHHQRSVHELVPEVPRPLSDLIDQLLEKHPAGRPDNALVVRDRLRNLDPELRAGVLPTSRTHVGEIVARFDGALISDLGHTSKPEPPAPKRSFHDLPSPSYPLPAARSGVRDTSASVFAGQSYRPAAAVSDGDKAMTLVADDAPLARALPAEHLRSSDGRLSNLDQRTSVPLLPVRRLPNLRAMVIAFAASLGAGLLQLLISWSGGIALNGQAEGERSRIFIGYLSSYHWWVSYTIIVPIIVSCTLPTWTAFAELQAKRARIARAIVLAAAFMTAAVIVISELLRVLVRDPLEACQWNYIHCRPYGVSYSPALRILLIALGYLHELLGYSGLLFTVLGVLAVSWFLRGSVAPAARSQLGSLLLNQRLCVVAYLSYLVLLRSSKVSNYLLNNGKRHGGATVVGMLSDWGGYFSVIAHGMGWTLFLGGAWIVATLVSHLLAAHANVRPTLSDDAYGVWLLVAEVARTAGRAFLLFILGAIVFIVLPPPGGPPLLALVAVIVGLAGWQHRRT